MQLTQCQQQQFFNQGYLVFEDFVAPHMVQKLKTRAGVLVEQLAHQAQHQIFSTKRNDRSGDDYFLNSAEDICCFFEEEAYDQQGQLVQNIAQSINKIAHAMHHLDPVFSEFSHTQALADIAKGIGMKMPQIRQSMYIFKQPNIGGEIKWHQDGSFFVTTPHSVVTFWFAIEDATLENGCLWLEPGGHKGPLREQFKRDGDKTYMVQLDNTPWPGCESAIPVELKAGGLVVFHSHLPHYSAPNRSARSRQAYTLHVTDGTCNYSKDNWLQADKLPLRGFIL